MGQAIENMFPDPGQAFQAQADRLARRRALAEQLVKQGMQADGGQGYHGGRVYAVGNQLGSIAQGIAGHALGTKVDSEQADLANRQRQYDDDTLQGIPAEAGPQRQQAQLRAMQNPSLREIIKSQLGIDENEAKRIEAGEQAAANRVEAEAKAEADRAARATEGELNRQNRIDLRSMPATVVHVGNGGGKPDADLDRELKQARIDAMRNPKPVASERKAALAQDDLVGRIDNALAELDRNPDAVGFRTYVPNVALNRLDPLGTAARAAIGELSAEKAHDIYGASFTAAERARADKFIPADGDDLRTVRTKLANMKKLAEQARNRAQPQQSGKPTPAPQGAVDYLRQHPEQSAAFKAKYGYLPQGF